VTRAEEKGKYMPKKKISPKIPKFKNEDEEREFWSNHDLADYIDQFEPVQMDLSKLKPSTETISLRLPAFTLMRIKELANAQDVPYQSLIKIFLTDRVKEELRKNRLA
jgi:predicted DNA binding CopG/RHH family protein